MGWSDEEAPAPCNCSAKTGYGACRCSWRRPRCTFLGCHSYSIWEDVDDGRVYCGAHAVLHMDNADVEEKRADFGREYAMDAAREGYDR